MVISEADLPRIIVERLEAHYPTAAIFAADEIAEWPDDTLPGLEALGLFQLTERAEFVICDGCHWCCSKPVVFRKQKAAARAFIVCDEEPDLGRIGIPIERLRQYRTTLNALARFLRDALGLTAKAPLAGSPPFLLGHMKGRYEMCSVSLLLEDRNIMLIVGSHSALVLEVLCFCDGRLAANRSVLRKLSNRKQDPTSARPRYQPDRTKQEKRASKTAQRDRAILAEARRIQSETGKKMTEISRELARLHRFRETGRGKQRFLTEKRIYRIIYEQIES